MVRRRVRRTLTAQARLEAFLRGVTELKERPYLFEGLGEFRFEIRTEPETGEVSSTIRTGDTEQLRSFLLTFRKFVLNNAPENLSAALHLAHRSVDDPELRDQLSNVRNQWTYVLNQGFIRISSGQLRLSPAFCLDLWLNGNLFHSDLEKAALLKELRESAVPSVDVQFHWSLRILAGLVLEARELISTGLAMNLFRLGDAD